MRQNFLKFRDVVHTNCSFQEIILKIFNVDNAESLKEQQLNGKINAYWIIHIIGIVFILSNIYEYICICREQIFSISIIYLFVLNILILILDSIRIEICFNWNICLSKTDLIALRNDPYHLNQKSYKIYHIRCIKRRIMQIFIMYLLDKNLPYSLFLIYFILLKLDVLSWFDKYYNYTIVYRAFSCLVSHRSVCSSQISLSDILLSLCNGCTTRDHKSWTPLLFDIACPHAFCVEY